MGMNLQIIALLLGIFAKILQCSGFRLQVQGLVSGDLRREGEEPDGAPHPVRRRFRLRTNEAPDQVVHPEPGERPSHHASERNLQRLFVV